MKLQKHIQNLNLQSPNVCKVLTEHLNRFCDYLNEEFDINSGGCCWTAYCIASLLEKTGFKYNLELVTYHDIEHIQSLEELEDSLSHYYLSITDYNGNFYYINSDDCESSYHNITNISKNDLLKHYLEHDWCCSYDHNKNQTIKSLLKTFYIDLLYDLSE